MNLPGEPEKSIDHVYIYIHIYIHTRRERKIIRCPPNACFTTVKEFLYSARCLLRRHMRWDRADEQKSSAQMHVFCYKGLMRKNRVSLQGKQHFPCFCHTLRPPGFGEPQPPTGYQYIGCSYQLLPWPPKVCFAIVSEIDPPRDFDTWKPT